MAEKKKPSAEETEELKETEAIEENTEAPEEIEDPLKKELDALKKELAEKDDRYLRLAAEYDNYRRRSSQERLTTYTEAVADAVKSILPILDDLERAGGYTEAEKVAEGLQIIAKSAQAALSKLGVEAFGEAGETFNADFHNAVMHIEDDTLGESVVAEVLQKGYKKGDKILRYAMVKVAN